MKNEIKLSSFFESKVQKVESTKDSESRIRNKVHIHGNWSTLIFIPIRLKEEVIERILKDFDKEFKAVDPIIDSEFPFHLSLSRTVYLKHHEKDLFCAKLTERLKTILKEFPLNSIELECEKLGIYTNDERSTTFIAVDLKNDSKILKYIKVIDSVLKEFRLPTYYQPAKLHFSLVWCAGDLKDDLIGHLGGELESLSLEILHENGIFVKCGNKISIIR